MPAFSIAPAVVASAAGHPLYPAHGFGHRLLDALHSFFTFTR